MTPGPNDPTTLTGPFYVDDPYDAPPGYAGPNTTGADLRVLSSGDPNALENLRILHAQENLRWSAYHDSKQKARRAALEGIVVTDIGRVILPETEEDGHNYLFWRSHATSIEENGGTPFNPNLYSAFDRQFQLHSNFGPLHNAAYDYPGGGSDSYSYYKPLRMNLAIVRNILYAQYFPDGEFNSRDSEDQHKREMLEEMAKELGGVFSRSTVPLVGETFSGLPVSLANIPDEGAQRIYRYLADNPRWKLKPIHETALADAQLAAFTEATSDVAGITDPLGSYLAKRAEHTKDMAIAAAQPRITPAEMDPRAQAQSIQEAKTILEKFRLQYSIASIDLDGHELPQSKAAFGEPQEDIVMADQLTMLARIYEQNVKHLATMPGGIDPEMQRLHQQTAGMMGKLSFALRDRAEWAIYNDWDDPQYKLKVQHLEKTFPVDGQGNPLPQEWRYADPGVQQPLLTYATGLYASIQAVQARMRQLQQDKAQDQRFTGLIPPEMSANADMQQPGQSITYTSGVSSQTPNQPPRQNVAEANLRQTQMATNQQNQAARSSDSMRQGAQSMVQGTATTNPNQRTTPSTQSQARAGTLPAQIKAMPGMDQAIKALQNMQTNSTVVKATVAQDRQRRDDNRMKAMTEVRGPVGGNTDRLMRKSEKTKTPEPRPIATPENVMPGAKNKLAWTPQNGPKGPSV